MRMTLRPPELGELVVRLHVAPGGQSATATLLAQHHETGDLLAQAAGDLRQALADRGLRLDRLEVTAGPLTGDARPDGAPSGAPSSQGTAGRAPHALRVRRARRARSRRPARRAAGRHQPRGPLRPRLSTPHERGGENTMSTDTTSAVSSTTATSSQVARTDTGGSLGQDAFLKLLVAQMQNQDPMQPEDSGQMMSQLASFSQVSAAPVPDIGQPGPGPRPGLLDRSRTDREGRDLHEGRRQSGVRRVTAVKSDPSGALLQIGTDEVHTRRDREGAVSTSTGQSGARPVAARSGCGQSPAHGERDARIRGPARRGHPRGALLGSCRRASRPAWRVARRLPAPSPRWRRGTGGEQGKQARPWS